MRRAEHIVKQHSFFLMVVWLVVLYGLDVLARKYSLYWIFPGFDKVMHFIGGIAIGLFAYLVLGGILVGRAAWVRILAAVAIAALVGGGWEVVEYVVNQVMHHVPFDAWDTATDVLSDILGGLTTFLYLTYF